jgi:hypothetical protein
MPLMADQVILAEFSCLADNIKALHAYMESLVYMIVHERKQQSASRQGGSVLVQQSAEAYEMAISGDVRYLEDSFWPYS